MRMQTKKKDHEIKVQIGSENEEKGGNKLKDQKS
jgi:hypothetical protein